MITPLQKMQILDLKPGGLGVGQRPIGQFAIRGKGSKLIIHPDHQSQRTFGTNSAFEGLFINREAYLLHSPIQGVGVPCGWVINLPGF